MQSFGAFDAKTHFSALLAEVENGEEILITKHGRVVAKLSPITQSNDDKKDAVQQLRQFQVDNQIVLGLDWKSLRDEGRDEGSNEDSE